MEIGIILGQDIYELEKILNYKIGTRSETFAVLTELWWVVSGPMTGSREQYSRHHSRCENGWEYSKMLEHRPLCFHNQCFQLAKDETEGKKMLEGTT